MDVVEASNMHCCVHELMAYRRTATPCGTIRDLQRQVRAIVAGLDGGVNVTQSIRRMSACAGPISIPLPSPPRERQGEGDVHLHRPSRALLEVDPLHVAASLRSRSLVYRIPGKSLRYACRGHPTRPLHICGVRLSSSAALGAIYALGPSEGRGCSVGSVWCAAHAPGSWRDTGDRDRWAFAAALKELYQHVGRQD
jgi:hypothetical protein